jgi:hypothetical protein
MQSHHFYLGKLAHQLIVVSRDQEKTSPENPWRRKAAQFPAKLALSCQVEPIETLSKCPALAGTPQPRTP